MNVDSMDRETILNNLRAIYEDLLPYWQAHTLELQLIGKVIGILVTPFLVLFLFLKLYNRIVARVLPGISASDFNFRGKKLISAPTLHGFFKGSFDLFRIGAGIGIFYIFFNLMIDLFPGPTADRILGLVRGLVLTGFAVISGYFIYRSINFAFRKGRILVRHSKGKHLTEIRYHQVVLISEERMVDFLIAFLRILELVSNVFLLYILIPIAFSFFEFTNNWAALLFSYIRTPLVTMGSSILNYLPNLFFIIVTVVVGKYILQFIRFLFSEVEANRIELKGFEPEWATPSYKILRFLVIVFLAIVIYPYFPGSETEAFKGVSIFLGLLFSLGSSTAIANIVAGVILTYMLPFRLGDRVTIGDITGDVIEKTLLVTRIRSIKNVVITIPNSSVLGNSIHNYTTSDEHGGLLIHTTVTLGYDVPWRKVYRAMVEAALATDGVMRDPEPFVLQTELGDFSVAYQINAYSDRPDRMITIKSHLHENIQDVCAREGIEILSPHYRTVRNDMSLTIPPVDQMKNQSPEGATSDEEKTSGETT